PKPNFGLTFAPWARPDRWARVADPRREAVRHKLLFRATKKVVAHGGPGPIRQWAYRLSWRSPCAIEGETPWLYSTTGAARRERPASAGLRRACQKVCAAFFPAC